MKDKKYLKIFILVVAVLIAIKVLFDFESVTGIFDGIVKIVNPFIFGFIIAYCINIPVTWLEEKIVKRKARWLKKAARPISVIVILAIIVSAIVFGLMSLIPMVMENAEQLYHELPNYVNAGLKGIKELPISAELGIDKRIEGLTGSDLLAFLPQPKPEEVTAIAGNVLSGVFNVFLTIVATIYFLAEYNGVKEFFKRFIKSHSQRRQRPVLKYVRLVDSSFRKFLSCQFLDALIVGTLAMIQLTAVGSPYAVTLGIMIGVTNVIPYFGAIFGAMAAVFVVWATSNFNLALIVAIMLLITQQIDGNFINPRIMGSSFKISPVVVIIAITTGGALGGAMGMLFAIPVANVIKCVLEEYINSKEEQREKYEKLRKDERLHLMEDPNSYD